MKSKNEKINTTKDLESPSKRRAILTTGAGAVAAVGATATFSKTNAKESVNNKNEHNMDGKTSLITGGARGIGLASAIALAKEGSNIVLYDVAEDLSGVNYPLATENNWQCYKKKTCFLMLFEQTCFFKKVSKRTHLLKKKFFTKRLS